MSYATNKNQYNCYTIECTDAGGKVFFGDIYNILSIDGEIYFIINLYKKGITTAPASFNELTRKHYDKYFFPVTKTDRYALISQKSLVRRCLLIDTKEHIILTPCVDLNEHD